jgi:hypothetical protein
MRYLKLFVLFSFLISTAVYAQSDFSGDDLSGKYSCAGKDHREGEYKGTVTMKLIPQHSVGKFAAYEFVLEVPGYGKYLGHASANGNQVAIYFAHSEHLKNQDFGIGIAKFKKNSQGKWSFKKFYFEPAFKGGNHGKEVCTQQ